MLLVPSFRLVFFPLPLPAKPPLDGATQGAKISEPIVCNSPTKTFGHLLRQFR